MQANPELPLPDDASAAHSAQVAAAIRAAIEAGGGSIGFAEYMQLALYASGLGYYAAGSTKFGAAGDFVTAPEVSPLFGGIVARQIAPITRGGGAVLELGAGSGRLAVDVLRRLADLDALPDAYLILEVSADLAERQRRLLAEELPELLERVRWLDALPVGHRGVILANEVLDALPVERFVRRERVQQQRVISDGDGFAFVEADAPELLVEQVSAIETELGERFADGYRSEVSLGLPGWVTDISNALDSGIVLLFDYGVSRTEYYAPDRGDGWLRCHFRQRAHSDPLILPGIQDITAWVDFTAVAEAAQAAGADILGYTTQSAFLLGGGIEAELDALASGDARRQLELSAAVKMLTLPGAMGESFKCLCLGKGGADAPAAITSNDRTHTL